MMLKIIATDVKRNVASVVKDRNGDERVFITKYEAQRYVDSMEKNDAGLGQHGRWKYSIVEK